jgi:hypothetical protein
MLTWRTVLAGAALVSLGAAPPPVTPMPAPAPACVSPPLGKSAPFSVGETLEYDIDSMGATVGLFRMTVRPGKAKQPLLIEARGRTGTFAANFYDVDAVATSLLGRLLDNQSYQETSTEGGVRRSLDVLLPPADGRLKIRSTREGERDDFELRAVPETRDLLATLYGVRSMNLVEGMELCLPVFAGRRVWTLRIKVTGTEMARTPAGDFQTLKLSGTAVRNDAPGSRRDVQFWLTNDALKLPVAACGLLQNKPVCANLTGWTPGRRKGVAAPAR